MPLVNSAVDEDLWGYELNTNFSSIDTLIKQGIVVTNEAIQTSAFTAEVNINIKKLYPCDATSGAFAVTLPSVVSVTNGPIVYIKKIDSSTNDVTIAADGGDTIDGSGTYVLSAENQAVALSSDGVSAWRIVDSTAVPIPDATTSVKGIVELATAAETLAGTESDKVITPNGFAGNKSLSSNGYYKFPGGLTLQWGSVNTVSDVTNVNYPVNFTNLYSVMACPGDADISTAAESCGVNNANTNNFEIYSYRNNSGAAIGLVYWFAVGET